MSIILDEDISLSCRGRGCWIDHDDAFTMYTHCLFDLGRNRHCSRAEESFGGS